MALGVGGGIRDERVRRRWTVRELAERARLSAAAVYAVEGGRPASFGTYVRLCDALGLNIEVELVDGRRRPDLSLRREADLVHAAIGELEVRRLSAAGFRTGLDEPYQHYQFAGRADVVAWDIGARALLHIENRTRFPDLQAAAGAWNAKRRYLAPSLAERVGLQRGWMSVVHVMVVLWSAEVLHSLRLRAASFRSLCPDPPDDFRAWWSGSPPGARESATLIALDPCATGRKRQVCSLDEAMYARARYRTYAEAAQAVRLAGR